MSDASKLLETVQTGYTFKGEHVKIGRAMFNGEVVPDADVFLPLKTLNRHGLIAGATGTGKTKTLQMISECMSDNSIPVLLMDIKGDLSGIAAAGSPNDKINARYQQLGMEYKPTAYPVDLMTLS
ncbi:MAG: helicase HerA-like domain-containing protein, partial [Bacteroidota bacterium]